MLKHGTVFERGERNVAAPKAFEAFQTPPHGPGTPFLFRALAMSRGDLASR
jgi:hypothetical protein